LILSIHLHSQIIFRKYLILIYVFALLIYIGIFFGLLAVNFKSQPFIESHYYLPFHLLAFWAVFAFTVIEAFILILSNNIKHKFQIILLAFNIVFTLMTAILFNIDPEEYEVVAHYLEYSIQIFISCVNLFFVLNLLSKKDTYSLFYKFRYFELLLVLLIILLSIFQLFFYTGLIMTGIEPERVGHFCEFTNEILNGGFALFYACTVYYDISKELHQCNESIKNH